MGKLDFPWTIILFVSFVWQVYVFSANSVCSKGPLEIYVYSSNILILLLIVSLCGFFFFASLCLRRSGGIPWVPFFSFVLSCSFLFNCKSYISLFVLASMCLQH